jgi:hypothetical protein
MPLEVATLDENDNAAFIVDSEAGFDTISDTDLDFDVADLRFRILAPS